jgi:23S rRNA pseudouridine2605 synthase
MARPRKTGGKTSFGKQTDAEKAFYKKKKERPARDGGDDRPRKSSSRSAGGFESRTSRPTRFGSKPGFSKRRSDDSSEGGGPYKRAGGFKKSYSGGAGKSFDKRKSGEAGEGGAPFKRSGGFKTSFSRGEGKRPFGKSNAGEGREDRPFKKSGGFKKPYSREGGEERPFRKSFGGDKPAGTSRFASKGFTKRQAGEERPFKKREGEEERPHKKRERGEERSFRKREGGEERTFRKREGSEERPFKKREGGSFKSRTEGSSRFSKRPAERKSFVQSRIEKARKTVTPREEKPKSDSDLIRLNKFLANSGVGSRREADELIKMGLVTVNGVTITEMGHKVKHTDDVRYEGKKLKAENLVYILLNKPKGFITTTDDPQERNTVMSLVASACKERIYPVGRLDRNTTGLLLLTNDGDLADKLTHPSYNVKKIYKVELDRPLTRADFEKIQEGVRLEEGRAVPDDLAIVSDDKKTVGIELHIGWNRIVRRIFESLDYQVVKLDRVVYAGLDKKDLARGQWRFLKPEEVVKLKHFS